MNQKAKESRYWVPMLGHAFRVLEAFYEDEGELSLQEICARLSISKSSIFRILYTLENLGYLYKNPDTGKYQLGLKILEAAGKVRSSRRLLQVARPHMRELQEKLGETINLAMRQNGDIVYLEILESNQMFRMAGEVGARAPLHASAVGKALCAYLPEETLKAMLLRQQIARLTPNTITGRRELLKEFGRIRERGYSLDEEEVELGASCVAVPLLNGHAQAKYAMSVSGPTPRIRAQQRTIIKELTRVCAEISQQLEP